MKGGERSRFVLCSNFLVLTTLCQLFMPVSVSQAETQDSSRAWEVKRETDPILDTTNITAWLRERGAKKSFLGYGKSLVVRCRERKLDAYIKWGEIGALGFSLQNEPAEVVVRFDSKEPETEKWPISTNYNATFTPQPAEFIGLLSQHKMLAARTYAKSGGSLTGVFDLSASKPVMREIKEACATDK